MTKRGMTLIELVVAMAIFMIIAMIAVGAFTSAVRMKKLTATMRESQQKLRISLEMISRLSRQANGVTVTSDNKTLVLRFKDKTGSETFSEFTIEQSGSNYDLFLKECTALVSSHCPDSNKEQLLGGVVSLTDQSSFSFNTNQLPPYLTIKLDGKIVGADSMTNNPYYTDDLNIKSSVILENLK